MKRLIVTFLLATMLAGFNSTDVLAQQQSIVNLILTSFNGANQGFPSLIKDTVSDFGGWQYKIDPKIVQQYAGVKDIKLAFKKNYKSILMKDNWPVQLNQMQIRSENIGIPAGKTWSDYKDTLTSYYNKIVTYFKQAFGSQLNYTNIIPLEDESQMSYKPRYLIFFYSKALTIPVTMSDKYEIEKLLDVTSWFTVELQEQSLGLAHYFNMQYRISGGQRQADN